MKNIKLWSVLTLFAMAFAFASCSHEAVNEPAQKKMVQFEVTNVLDVNVSDMSAPRRAAAGVTPGTAKLTDIWLFVDGEIIRHQECTDSDFGYPTLELTYGQHTVSFIASGQNVQEWVNNEWHTDNPKETYGYVLDLNVTSGTSVETIVLSRICCNIKWGSYDNVPSNARTVVMRITQRSTSVNTNLNGVSLTLDSVNYLVQDKIGSTVSVNMYSFPYANAATGDSVDTSVTFYDSSKRVISSHSKRVPVWANKVTEIRGDLFGCNPTAPLQVDNTAMEVYNVEL